MPENPLPPATEPQTPPEANSDPLTRDQILAHLASPDADMRSTAIEAATTIEKSTPELVHALEEIAARDPIPELRAQALNALTHPLQQAVQWTRHGRQLSLSARHLLHREIQTWGAEGLLSDEQVRLLRQRYPLSNPQKKPASTSQDVQREKRTLAQLLTSEITVQIALYLGAFFVIAAALLFAAVVESARVPILGALSLAGFGIALGLFKKLHQPSFVFFIIGTFLFVITSRALINQVGVLTRLHDPAWMLVWFTAGFILLGGTFLYRSRLLSIIALWAVTAAALYIGNWVDASSAVYLLLLTHPLLPALGLTWLLRRWQGKRLFWPLFIAAQLQQILLLGGFSTPWLIGLISNRGVDWVVFALVFMLAGLFFIASNALIAFALFPLFAIATLLPVPLLATMGFNPPLWLLAVIAWGWGAMAALGGQILTRLKWEWLHIYGRFTLWGSAAVLLFSAGVGGEYRTGLAAILLFASALLYLGLTFERRGAFTWTSALTFGVWGYLMLFTLKPIDELNIPISVIFLLPALALLGGDLLPRQWLPVPRRGYWPPRVLGLISAALSILTALWGGVDAPWTSVAVFAALAGFAIFYAIVDGLPQLGAAGTALFALTIPYIAHALGWDHWLILVYGLAALYWGAGMLLGLSPSDEGKRKRWSIILRISGLALGTLGALSVPFQGGAIAVFGTAVIASLFIVEAVRLRNIWLGFPANLVYLIAWFMALSELGLKNPQFYVIGAALLGVVMHYLLLRTRQDTTAVITGVLSQLLLLGTTYIQLVADGGFGYFFLIFLHALVLLVYGLVVRSRSFVGAPIIFAVLSVITVVLHALSGLATVLLIGCTGSFLLLFGILALLTREQISKKMAVWRSHSSGWRG